MTEPNASPPASRKTGIVFVHGIGTQPPRETFLNWAEPIVRMLSILRREMDDPADGAGAAGPAGAAQPVGEDPVRRAGVQDERAWAEIDIPARPGRASDTWVITESYWAGDIRAPGLVDTIGYLRRHLPAMIRGVAAGWGQREPRRVERLKELIGTATAGPGGPGGADAALVAELRQALSGRWSWIDLLDQVWQHQLVRLVLGAVGTVVTLVALAIYAPLRALPIKAIQERAELAAVNTFLSDWFGDIPVLLDDRVQAAMVRSRLEASIHWLVERGCDHVVVVAHSGGAIVSYSALLRLTGDAFPVAKLITLGQGLSLAWRLLKVDGQVPVGHPLRGDLGAAHPKMRWVDFWASYDPAPAGPLVAVEGCPLDVSFSPGPPSGSPIKVESRPVTNYMHLGLDHGAYWDNDEGFLVPLVRHLDDPEGDGARSRFYGSALARVARIERRRRRVGILLGWRWLAFGMGLLSVLFAAVAPGGLAGVGHTIAWTWSLVPGHEWLTGPIESIGAVVTIVLGILRLGGVSQWLGDLGPWLLGALLPVVGTVLIYRRGVQVWHQADRAERAKIRREKLGRAGEAWARSDACLLVGGLVALVVAALIGQRVSLVEGSLAIVVIVALTGILGLVIRGLPQTGAPSADVTTSGAS